MLRRHPLLADAALAGAVAVAAVAELLSGHVAGPLAAGIPLALVMAVPLALRRRRPLAVLTVVIATYPIQRLAGIELYDYLASVAAAALAIYTVAARLERRVAVICAALAYAVIVATVTHGGLSSIFWIALVVGGTCAAGCAIRAFRNQAAELAELARRLDAEQEENARVAVFEERTRIARELHDVVAHAVSVMVVQAAAAEQVLGQAPGSAREPLRSVQQTGRQALVELRRLLGVLRADGIAPAREPQPGLADLPALAAQLAEAGLPVRVDVEGEPAALTPGLELAAYRIVQEALTNTLKHAAATRAEVAVRYARDAVELEVRDDGRGAPVPPQSAGGHGLVGMRERTSLYGGAFEAGPDEQGGFGVRVRLPLAAQ